MKNLLIICVLIGLININGVLFRQKNKNKLTTVKEAGELFDLAKDAFCSANLNLGLFKFNTKAFGKLTLDPYARKVANDQGAWTFDAMDPLFSKLFGKEADAAWKFFHSQSKEGLNPFFEDGTTSPLPKEAQDAMVGFVQLQEGLTKSGLLVTLKNRTPKEIMNEFDNNGDHFFNYQELLMCMIELTSKTMFPINCKNCLEDSRKQLKLLFDYMDCDKDGLIDAEDMWNGFKEMKSFQLFTTACTNDLELKCDLNRDAKLSPQEWTEGVLHGYWERQVGVTGPSDAYKALKKVREQHYTEKKKKAVASGNIL